MPTPTIPRLRASLRSCLLPGLLPGLVLGLATTAAPADTYTVAPGSPGTIQALIDLVLVDGDVIQLEAGTYLLPDTITIIDRSITIRGVSDPKTGEPPSILDGQDTHRVCLTNGGSNTFEGLVFTPGFAFSSDGGTMKPASLRFETRLQKNTSRPQMGPRGALVPYSHNPGESVWFNPPCGIAAGRRSLHRGRVGSGRRQARSSLRPWGRG